MTVMRTSDIFRSKKPLPTYSTTFAVMSNWSSVFKLCKVKRNSTTDDDVWLDVKDNGFFESRLSRIFFGVKVFYPFAKI